MSFGFVLREIQAFEVSVSVLKSVSFESDISLWSSSIELKFWTNIEDIYLMCLSKSHFTRISDQSKVICVWSSFAKLLWQKLFWEDIKAKFWSEANTTWENLKEGVWRLGSTNTLSRPSYKSVVCNHVLNTIRNIIRDTYLYVKPMYSIEFCIILKTYIHMQSSSCLALTLTLILETQGRN